MNRQIDHDRMVIEIKAENARLKELNQEMVEALSWAAEHSTSLHLDLLIKIRELLAKAEEGESE